MISNYDFSQFSKRISIKADPSILLNYWLTQDNIEKWFLSQAQFYDSNNVPKLGNALITKGDTYNWVWRGSDNVAEGKILDTDHASCVSFTFLGANVNVTISQDSGENNVEVHQYNIPIDSPDSHKLHIECVRGWTFYMANLKSIVEGRIDLRNKNKNLAGVINT